MDNVVFGFLLTSLAGLSTLLGSFVIFFVKGKSDQVITCSLSFAAGVMITVSLTDLIPESFQLLSEKYLLLPSFLFIFVFVTLGIVCSMLIDKYLPTDISNTTKNSTLYRVGFISMLAIILHNIPEGIATFMATNHNAFLGITLTIAIALHNIPEGISISVPIYYATNSRKKAFFYTLISGLSEPLGALIAYFFLAPLITNQIMGLLFAMIAGIMIHISIYELLPTSIQYQNKKLTITAFIIGSLIMCINHFCF